MADYPALFGEMYRYLSGAGERERCPLPNYEMGLATRFARTHAMVKKALKAGPPASSRQAVFRTTRSIACCLCRVRSTICRWYPWPSTFSAWVRSVDRLLPVPTREPVRTHERSATVRGAIWNSEGRECWRFLSLPLHKPWRTQIDCVKSQQVHPTIDAASIAATPQMPACTVRRRPRISHHRD